MDKTMEPKPIAQLLIKIMLWCAGVVLLVFVLLVLPLKIYLTTTLAASQMSRLLTNYLHQPVQVSGLNTSGSALRIKGLSMSNPVGFPSGKLITINSLTIAPGWSALLFGRRSFRLVALEGVRINLCQNRAGIWNFVHLQQALTGGKPAAHDLFIRQFFISDGDFLIDGKGVNRVAINISNLATKGSDNSNFGLSFEDTYHNGYNVTGKARLGNDTALDLNFSAPSVSFKNRAAMLNFKNSPFSDVGNMNLGVSASLRRGLLKLKGKMVLNGFRLPLSDEKKSLFGNMEIAADYDLHKDEARLESLVLSVNNLLKIQAAGTVEDLRHSRRFALEACVNEIDAGSLISLLPASIRDNIGIGGKLGSTYLRISGNKDQGVTGASGNLKFRDGTLSRKGQLLLSGLAVTADLSRLKENLFVKGKMTLKKSHEKAFLETIDAPFAIVLSPSMKPLNAELPSLSARVMGIPFTARIAFNTAAANTFTAVLAIPSTTLETLNPLLEKTYDLKLTAGHVALTLEVAGHGPLDFTSTIHAQLGAIAGRRGSKAFGLKSGDIVSHVKRDNGHAKAAGNARLGGMAIGKMTGTADFSYRAADGAVSLDNAAFVLNDTSVAVAHLTTRIPVKKTTFGIMRYPLTLDISNCAIRRGEIAADGLSGSLQGAYASGNGDRWLEGTANLSSKMVLWTGKPIGNPVAHFIFSHAGAKANIKGNILNGTVRGDAFFNPFAFQEGGTFSLEGKGVRLSKAADFITKKNVVTASDGLLDVTCSGGYSPKFGLNCGFEIKGKDIALTGNGKKTLLSGAVISLHGGISGQKISITDAALAVGKGVTLKVTGTLDHSFSLKRDGRIVFALPRTPLNSIIEPFVNVLPKLIQEATVDGSLAAEGVLDLHDGKKLFEGSIGFGSVHLDVPSQTFSVTDINGSLPFSLDFSGGSTGKGHTTNVGFSRQNYPRLLEQLSQTVGSGPVLNIAKASFGPMEIGPINMRINSGNGITEIVSLNSSFYEGSIHGKGEITAKDGLQYRGDLLVSGLSLKQLCSKFPQISGYLSGRIDGILSVQGKGNNLSGLTGFTDLWARESTDERMLVSKEFLQRLSGKKLSGFFFSKDRSYDQAEIKAILEKGNLAFDNLDILHTNFIGVRDLSVSIAPSQNRIALDHLLNSVKQATNSGKAATGNDNPPDAPLGTEFKWQE